MDKAQKLVVLKNIYTNLKFNNNIYICTVRFDIAKNRIATLIFFCNFLFQLQSSDNQRHRNTIVTYILIFLFVFGS